MKRMFINNMNQIIVIPTIGILRNEKGILLSIEWLNVGCSILLIDKRK